MAYQMVATVVTLKVIHRLQAFAIAIRRTFLQLQHFTQFQQTVCSHGSSALAYMKSSAIKAQPAELKIRLTG